MSDSASVPTSTEAQDSLVVEVSDFPRVVLPLSVGPRRPRVETWDPASPSDITNYAYVWYKTDPAQLSQFSEDELDKIHEIIMNYSYPCYLAGYDLVRLLPDDQKSKLLNSELVFIREKMIEANLGHIVIIQIPRILYDLFNIYCTDNTTSKYHFLYTCSYSLRTLDNFNEFNKKNTRYCKQSIFSLNNRIINYLNANNYLDNIESYYDAILDALTYPRYPKPPGLIRVHDVITYKIDEGLSNRLTDDNEFLQRLRILRETLDFEKQKSKGRINLYRAAILSSDNVGTQSLSLNTSMLTGCDNDRNGACTFNLCSEGYQRPDGQFFYTRQKIIYNIKKFLVGDSSPEYLLFFIPPIHPFLQVYCGGELFHARTKFGIPYPGLHDDRRGIACGITAYLKSTRTTEELQRIYVDYKERNKIFIWYLSNETRPPVIRPQLPPLPDTSLFLPGESTLAKRLAKRFRALFTGAPSQPTLPQPQPQPRPLTHAEEVWKARLMYHRGGGKKKYFSKQHHSLRRKKSRRNKSRRNKSRRKNKSRRN